MYRADSAAARARGECHPTCDAHSIQRRHVSEMSTVDGSKTKASTRHAGGGESVRRNSHLIPGTASCTAVHTAGDAFPSLKEAVLPTTRVPSSSFAMYSTLTTCPGWTSKLSGSPLPNFAPPRARRQELPVALRTIVCAPPQDPHHRGQPPSAKRSSIFPSFSSFFARR